MLRDGQVIADGSADDVVNGRNLQRLYNTAIRVVETDDGMRVCVPRLMRERFAGKKQDDADYYRAAS